MQKKVQISVEEIKQLKVRLSEINSYKLEDIEFIENGEKIEIEEDIIEEFKFVGLSNCDFITAEFYKNGFEEIEQKFDEYDCSLCTLSLFDEISECDTICKNCPCKKK